MNREQVIKFFNELKGSIEKEYDAEAYVYSPTSPAKPYEVMEALVYLQFKCKGYIYHVSINVETNKHDYFELYYVPREEDPGILKLGKFKTKEEFLQFFK